jgi:hypothetical protein
MRPRESIPTKSNTLGICACADMPVSQARGRGSPERFRDDVDRSVAFMGKQASARTWTGLPVFVRLESLGIDH